MRILHVLPQFPYFGGTRIVGGYPSTVLNLVERQQGEHDVEIMSRTFDETPSQTSAGSPIHRLGDAHRAGTPLRTGWFMVRAALAVARRRSDFDVIHVHSGYVDYLLLAALLRVASGRTTVATFYCPASPRQRRRKLQRLIVKTCGRIVALSGMSENVCVSVQELVSTAQCAHTPPLIDPDVWDRAHVGHPSESPSEQAGGALRVLFVGNASTTKGLDVLFAAAATARAAGVNLSLTVTTELDRTSPDSRITRLRELATELDLDEHINYLGIVGDMRELLHMNDVHVAPFRNTQGPSDYFVSSLEAMAAGICVIASRLDGMCEVIEHGSNGLLADPGDPEDLARQFVTASSSKVRHTLGEAARHSMQNGRTTPAFSLARFEDFYDAARTNR